MTMDLDGQNNDGQSLALTRDDPQLDGPNHLRSREALTDQSSCLTLPIEGYSRGQRLLHWIIAALVLFQLCLGILIGTMNGQMQFDSLMRNTLIVHLITGSLIFILTCARLVLRRRFGAPTSPHGTPVDAAILARINHLGFYVLLLAMPVVGWLAYLTPGRAGAAWGALHGGLAVILVLAICAHLCGAFYHHFIRHDGVVRRMLG
jgi:cytochrome b561